MHDTNIRFHEAVSLVLSDFVWSCFPLQEGLLIFATAPADLKLTPWPNSQLASGINALYFTTENLNVVRVR